MWSDLEECDGNFLVRKNKPNQSTCRQVPSAAIGLTADALGRWPSRATCLLQHGIMGMFREVRVDDKGDF